MSFSASESNGGVEAPALVYLTNKWISELATKIRSRPIPWEGYHRADLLSAEELKMIKNVDSIAIGQNRSKLDPLLDQHGHEYVSLYLRLLSKLSRTDTLQQILVLIDDMLANRDDRLALFLSLDGQEEQNGISFPWKPFVKLLDVPDEFVQLKSAQFLTLLLVFSAADSSQPKPPSKVLGRLIDFLASLIRGASTTTSASSSTAHVGSTSSSSSSTTASAALTATSLAKLPSSVGTRTNGTVPSSQARRRSPDYAEGNGPEIALVLLEALLRVQGYRKQLWAEEVQKMGQIPAKASHATTDQVDSAAEAAEQGLLPELVHILRYNAVRSGSALNSSVSSPIGSGSTTPIPSRQTTTSAGSSTLVAGNSSINANGASSRANIQLIYQIVLVFWLLSFDEEIAEQINVKLGIVPALIDVARSAVKEKVTRVTVATLRNLVSKAPESNAPAMLGYKALPLCENLIARKWSDEEIEQDLVYIRDELAHRLKGMSTFDEYLTELSSGKLTFENPVHELDEFWKQNAPKFVEKDGEILHQLVEILKHSQDSTTLAVVCSDIGKFVHFFEPGKKRLNELGAKVRIMDLMTHQDPQVQFHALDTVSKLVSASWR